MNKPSYLFYHANMHDSKSAGLYETVQACIQAHGKQIRYPNLFGNDIPAFSNITKYVYNDHPEFFYFDLNNTLIQHNNNWITIQPKYFYTPSETKQLESRIDQTIYKIINECFPEGYTKLSLLRREKVLFDWVSKNIVYNHAAIEKREAAHSSGQSSMAWNAYGALVERNAVCHGIACAFKALCDVVGIECIVVCGKAGDGGHAWNIIKIDNYFYHVDCTWDLRSSISLHIPFARFRYFNLPDQIIQTNHQFREFHYPECHSLIHNPFHMRGFYVEKYNDIIPLAIKHIRNNLLRFAFMCIGFQIDSTSLDQLSRELKRVINKNISLYLDANGCFIGFVVN